MAIPLPCDVVLLAHANIGRQLIQLTFGCELLVCKLLIAGLACCRHQTFAPFEVAAISAVSILRSRSATKVIIQTSEAIRAILTQ